MKKKLGRNDFQNKDGYLSFKNGYCEICIEPCLNGADIAVYDLGQELFEPKICTNLGEFGSIKNANIFQIIDMWKIIDKEVNKFYKKYGFSPSKDK